MSRDEPRRRGRTRVPEVAVALLFLTVAACAERPGADPPRDDGAPAETDAPAPPAEPATPDSVGARPADPAPPRAAALADSTDWTIGLLEAPSTLDDGPPPVPVLTALRAGVHPDWERATFELEGAAGLPGYRIEYVDRPLYDCGSGEPTYPVGDAWLEVRFYPAAAHTEEGRPTLGARDLAVDQPLLRHIYRTCDFEAVVVHVLALSAPNAFRVMTLADPVRIVVDVRR